LLKISADRFLWRPRLVIDDVCYRRFKRAATIGSGGPGALLGNLKDRTDAYA